jgi:hypothetical protein
VVNDVLGLLDYSAFAEAALALFLFAFVAVSVAMARVTPRWSDRCAAIPLTDDESEVNARTARDAVSQMERTQ